MEMEIKREIGGGIIKEGRRGREWRGGGIERSGEAGGVEGS